MSAYRGLLFALIGGIVSAILSIGSFGSAPILGVGLALGSALAGVSAAIAALLILLNLNAVSTIFFIAGMAIPAVLIVRKALISQPGATPNTQDWYPPGNILAWLTAYGILVLGCVAVYFAFSSDTMAQVSGNFLREFFGHIIQQSEPKFRSDADRAIIEKLFNAAADKMAPLLVGFQISFHLLLLVIISTATQGILNQLSLSLRPSPSYISLVLPRWLSGALAAAVIVAFLPGGIGILGQNALMIVSIPFLLLGLTVIHTLSRRTPTPAMVLVSVYFALFMMAALINISLPTMALLVLLGVAEQWSSLRQRLTAPGTNQEDE